MATIDYKQKIKDYLNSSEVDTLYKSMLNNLFPELKESDEDIRASITEFFKEYSESGTWKAIPDVTKWIEWLEKKYEQKPNPYSGISFEYNGHWWGMCARDNGVDIMLDKQLFKHLEKQGEYKLYVNDNAKEMFIKALERVEEQNNKGYKLTDCDKNSWWEDFKVYTTSEQNLANSAKTCKDEQKPTWNEEDEEILDGIIVDVVVLKEQERTKDGKAAYQKEIDWLKSLKDRILPQNITYYNPYKEVVESIADMVEKFAPFDSNLQDFYDYVKVKCKDAKEYDSLYPHNTWKPSDEQMHYLSWIANIKLGDSVVEQEVSKHLNELYENLLKLKE